MAGPSSRGPATSRRRGRCTRSISGIKFAAPAPGGWQMNQLVRPPINLDTPDTLPALPFRRPLYRLTVEQYHRMTKSDVFVPDNRVELLDGFLVKKMPPNPPHATSVRKTARRLHGVVPEEWIVSV